MVKNLGNNNINNSRKTRIPIRLLLFWYKKIKAFINTQNLNLIKDRECPTIYVSKKYPKMSILELYQRINNHLNKYFPNIYHKLNSDTENYLIKPPENNEQKESQEKSNAVEPKKEEKKKELYILIKIEEKNIYLEEKMKSNEKSCKKIEHLLKQYEFGEEIYEKYNDHYVDCILIENNNENHNDNDNNKKNNNDFEMCCDSTKDISPSKCSTTSSSSSFTNNTINFLTHLKNSQRKIKYFNNDDYYINKLKLIGNYNGIK